MELTKVKIAKLVLGYLKTEKYNVTFNMFLEESEYMKEFKENIKAGKYFGTRVMGMNLVEMLEEYASIYNLVQGPLEASNFYDENKEKATPRLLEQIRYLLDSNHFGNSSPIAAEVDTTPVHELPGNIRHADTPKPRKSPKTKTSSKSGDSNDPFDVSEVFAQTLLESHELHEKIAETINKVRNTPEVPRPNVQSREEKIGAGASQELEHVIKKVVERTEEEPLYNRLLDEIMECCAAGTVPPETFPQKSSHNDFSGFQLDKTKSKLDNRTSIEDHNDDAVRSIIEASQQPPPLPVIQPANFSDSVKTNEVIVYDGSLESYLKTAGGGTNVVPPNPVYVSSGRYIVMPQAPPATTTVEDPSTIYLVNNQPSVLSVAPVVKTITDNDIMTMPTIIVNDGSMSSARPQTVERKLTRIAPKMSTAAEEASEFLKLPAMDTVTTSIDRKRRPFATKSVPTAAPSTSRPQTPPLTMTLPKSSTPRQASHVRNLDFSSPLKMNQVKLSQSVADKLKTQPAKVQTEQKAKPAAKRAWDEDLRQGIALDLPKTPPKKKPKRRGACNTRSSKAKKVQEDKEVAPPEPKEPSSPFKEEEPKTFNDSTLDQAMELERNLESSPPFRADPKTPLKDTMPKTPGGDALFGTSSLIMKNNCTPFTQVLEEQLKDVDLMAIPTPSLPITPGFAFTPNIVGGAYVSRSTDYSTTSSYYQPSDTEHNKSIEQLVEECRTYETRQATAKENLQIISHIVIKSNMEVNDKPMENKVDAAESSEAVRNADKNEPESNQNCDDILKKFNSNVIGKKNLNLLKSDNEVSSSSSSSSSSDSESEKSDEQSNKTVIHKRTKPEDSIRDILKQADYTAAAVITEKKPIVSDLEEVRKRTVRKIQSDKSLIKKPRKPPVKKPQRKAPVPKKKVEKETVPKTDDEAQKLVDGLRQRGIHLVHNKTPKKIDVTDSKEELPEATCNDATKKTADVAPTQGSPRIEQRNDEPNEFPVFDRVTYETVLDVKHAPQGRRKQLAEYDFALLNKSINAEVYSEDLNMELTRRIHSTCHFTLLDMPEKEKVNMLVPRKTKRSPTENKSATPKAADEDDLMDFVVTGVLNSPDGKSKRRRRTSGEDKQAKKTRQYENNKKLLNNINMDDFLNKLHGGN